MDFCGHRSRAELNLINVLRLWRACTSFVFRDLAPGSVLRDHPLFYLLVRSVLSFSTCSLPSPSQYLSRIWHAPSANIPIQPLQSGHTNIHSSRQGRGKIPPADGFHKSLSPGPCATSTSQMASPHGAPPQFVCSKAANYPFLPCFEILTLPTTHTLFQLSCFPHSRLAIRICNLWASLQTDELLKIQPLQAPIQLPFLYFLLFIFLLLLFFFNQFEMNKALQQREGENAVIVRMDCCHLLCSF